MRSQKFLSALLAAGAVHLALAGAAQAVPSVFWTNKDGTADNFTWENGGSDTGLFGDPILVGGNTFVFFPSNFRAESADGGTDDANDRLEVTLHAKDGFTFSQINITEFGDYSISGNGSVEANGTLFLTRLNDSFKVLTDDLVTDPLSPMTTAGSGEWEGAAGVDLSVEFPGWTDLTLVLNNNLIAITDGSSDFAFIEKKVVGGGIKVEVIPEPATVSLLAFGGLALLRRRKR